MTIKEEIAEAQDAVGPKRVETKEMEIEAHDPIVLQRAIERKSAKPVLFSQFPVTRVFPNESCTACSDRRDNLVRD